MTLPSVICNFTSSSCLSSSSMMRKVTCLCGGQTACFIILLFVALFFSSLRFDKLASCTKLPSRMYHNTCLLYYILFLLWGVKLFPLGQLSLPALFSAGAKVGMWGRGGYVVYDDQASIFNYLSKGDELCRWKCDQEYNQ